MVTSVDDIVSPVNDTVPSLFLRQNFYRAIIFIVTSADEIVSLVNDTVPSLFLR